MMVAASTSETSVNFYQTARRNIPEVGHFMSLISQQMVQEITLNADTACTFHKCLLFSRREVPFAADRGAAGAQRGVQ
jgi:hypothetical protein